MSIISRKYKKKFAIFLLAEFLTFTLLGVFHFHKFNFSNEYSINQTSSSPLTSSDLSSDFFSYCGLHQFNQSVIKYDNAKIIYQKLADFGQVEFLYKSEIKPPIIKSNLIPRAPPLSI